MATVALSGIITPTNVVTATSTTTLTNKTLTAPTIASANLTTALTLAGAAGTNGQVLTSAGSGLPSWTTIASGGLTLGTSVAATSGTSIDFTGIPAGTKQIFISFVAVSLSGSSHLLVQLGDAGGIETSDYIAQSVNLLNSTAISSISSTSGFPMRLGEAGERFHGIMTLILEKSSTNYWVSSHIGRSETDNGKIGAGSKPLSATLDRVRITTVNGTDTFDWAGAEINIAYQ